MTSTYRVNDEEVTRAVYIVALSRDLANRVNYLADQVRDVLGETPPTDIILSPDELERRLPH